MSDQETRYDADVIVIGGDPAGSAISSYLAMNGYSTALSNARSIRASTWGSRSCRPRTACSRTSGSGRRWTTTDGRTSLEGDYSYKMDRFTGNGWLLVGDAARFVDPIFSSGVSVAVSSAKFAFEALHEALQGGDERAALDVYDQKVGRGVQIWYEWITIYYKLQALFTRLGKDPENKRQMQQLLQGDVYDRSAVDVLDRMRALVKTVEETEGHILKPMLSDSVTVAD